jgi:microcystin-dependent protein
MLDWPTTSSYPTGYLRADGTAVSRTSYADLFALISTTYGVGDNSTTFNLPNLVSAGSGSPVKIIKASLGGIVEPSTVAHASSHAYGGSDPVTIDSRLVDWSVVGYPASRNVIINGSMSVAQRATSVASITSGGYKTADRWTLNYTTLGTWTQSVENDAPTGSEHRKSLKMLCTTAKASPSAGDFCAIGTVLEGQNLQNFCKGTSSAKKFALSFWVKANVTGTYAVYLLDNDNSRSTSKQYTISASATWEKKTLVFDADTTGSFDNNNEASLQVFFGLAGGSTYTSGSVQSWGSIVNGSLLAGQTNLAASSNNYWQVTGVQLEPEVVTPFEFEPFETTLRKCQRYFYETCLDLSSVYTVIARGGCYTSQDVTFEIPFPVSMRVAPTTLSVSSNSHFRVLLAGIASEACTGITFASSTRQMAYLYSSYNSNANLSVGRSVVIQTNNTSSARLALSAEL